MSVASSVIGSVASRRRRRLIVLIDQGSKIDKNRRLSEGSVTTSTSPGAVPCHITREDLLAVFRNRADLIR